MSGRRGPAERKPCVTGTHRLDKRREKEGQFVSKEARAIVPACAQQRFQCQHCHCPHWVVWTGPPADPDSVLEHHGDL
eukprot:3497572-Alexandrium_andersonii.AAC.1